MGINIIKASSKLSTWKGKFVSYGGQVVSLNLVLNSILLLYFSFYKAPKIMIHEIIKIQRTFLWKGDENKRRINRVLWSLDCKPKINGGLGNKQCKLFNAALLSKWA